MKKFQSCNFILRICNVYRENGMLKFDNKLLNNAITLQQRSPYGVLCKLTADMYALYLFAGNKTQTS